MRGRLVRLGPATGRLKCAGRPATVVGELDPFGRNVVFGTPRNDVIVGTGEDDLIRAAPATT